MADANNGRRVATYFIIMVSLLIFIPVGAAARRKGDDDSLVWFVRIYPKNPDYIEVLMDPRYIPRDHHISGEIRYEVSFYTQEGRLLGTKVFYFTKEIKDSRRVYRQYVPHPYGAAKQVRGGTAYYSVRGDGTLYELSGLLLSRCFPEPPKSPEIYGDGEELVVNWRLLETFPTDQLNAYPYLIRGVDGKLRPTGGYRWVNLNDPDDFRVTLRPNLVEREGGELAPAGGYRWVNSDDPDDFRVVLMPGLSKGGDGKLYPTGGYRWLSPDNPRDFCVVLMPGLLRGDDGKLRPANGYRWVRPDDPNDFRVEPIP